MQKTATITISLVDQASNITNHNSLAKDIKESLRCDWLADVKKVKIEN